MSAIDSGVVVHKLKESRCLVLVDWSCGITPLLTGGRPNRCRVFLKSTAAPTDPTSEELLTEPVSRCGRLGDLVGVNAERFAHVPDAVVWFQSSHR